MATKKKFIRITLWLGCGSKFETEGHNMVSALVDAVNAVPFEVRQEIKKRLEISVDSQTEDAKRQGEVE